MRRANYNMRGARWPWMSVVVALVLLLATGAATAATPFYKQLVDSQVGGGGVTTAIAVDVDGTPHIAYTDYTQIVDNDLKYAVRVGKVWTIETVDSLGDVGQDPSIVIDAQGNPHVTYHTNATFDLKYAVKSDGVWTIETIDATGSVGLNSSLVLDDAGIPHVSYSDATNRDLKYAVKPGGVWTTETVDAAGFISGGSLALDGQGRPHIGYTDVTNNRPKYAVKSNGTWTIEVVDPSGGGGPSIALDGAGNPRISYQGNSSLKYAEKSGGTWQLTTVDANGTVGRFSSLALDGQGNPHIDYEDNTNSDLKYAVRRGGVWTIEVVDAPGNSGIYPSMVLDVQGNAHISFHHFYNGLIYASAAVCVISPVGGEHWVPGSEQTVSWEGAGIVDVDISFDGGASYQTLATSETGGEVVVTVPATVTDAARVRVARADPFSSSASPAFFEIGPSLAVELHTETVDANGRVGSFTSLELDGAHRAHVSYFDADNDDLKYAVKTGGAWAAEAVDSSGSVGRFSSLALDAAGNPHVSYDDFTNDALKYAVKSGGVWTTETVDPSEEVGWGTSLALDAAGNPHVTYSVLIAGDLKYAVKSDGVWMIETVDAAGDVGRYSSLALDAAGNPHVTYYDATNSTLKYAVKSGGVWSIEIADAAPVRGLTSLVLDEAENPHVSYLGVFDLKYAVRSGGVWTTETVFDIPFLGSNTSLTLDEAGDPHIGFYDTADDDLMYAVKSRGVWTIETVDAAGNVGASPSLALDEVGNPHLTYTDLTGFDLKYATSTIAIEAPLGGETWPVGSERTVSWRGAGVVDISLSIDGGASYTPLADNVNGGSFPIVVPHTPSHFCRIKIERTAEDNTFLTYYYPPGIAESDSFFTIETSISLLNFVVTIAEQGPGQMLHWGTDPGPEDLAGYRVERRHGTTWVTVVDGITQTSYLDANGEKGDRYRLHASNKLGDEFLLGESGGDRPPQIDNHLTAWPVPFRAGELQIRFGVAGAGGVAQATDVTIYDVAGRRVRTVARISKPGGDILNLTWDGRDDGGRTVSSGVYFIRVRSGQTVQTRKVVIAR